MPKTTTVLALALGGLTSVATATIVAQETAARPDFTGVRTTCTAGSISWARAVTDTRRSDFRWILRWALGRRHAGRQHRGDTRGHSARLVLAAQRSTQRAGADSVLGSRHPRRPHHRDGSEGVARAVHPGSTYGKASPPNDELRQFSCAEGLLSVK
jgi:hypothetical protein